MREGCEECEECEDRIKLLSLSKSLVLPLKRSRKLLLLLLLLKLSVSVEKNREEPNSFGGRVLISTTLSPSPVLRLAMVISPSAASLAYHLMVRR